METPIPAGSFSLYDMVIDWWDLAKIAGGALLMLLGIWLKARRPRVTWRVTHTPVAGSVDDPVFGNIAVTRNGMPVRNLVLSTITAQNSYSRDFKDAVVRVLITPTHWILNDQATRRGSSLQLDNSLRFQSTVDRWHAEFKQNPDTPSGEITRWREYTLPVWNRGEELQIVLLVEAPPPANPYCEFSTDIEGAVTVFQKTFQQVVGVPSKTAVLAGVIAIVPLAWSIVAWVPVGVQPFMLVFLGLAVSAIGALLVKAYRAIRSRLL